MLKAKNFLPLLKIIKKLLLATEYIEVNRRKKLDNIKNLAKYLKNSIEAEEIIETIKAIEENLNHKQVDIYQIATKAYTDGKY
jgi:uncharacterized protein YeeX (DUF496 family)